jgi:hypothetical protein
MVIEYLQGDQQHCLVNGEGKHRHA